MNERTEWPDPQISRLATELDDFRRESKERHKELEVKIDTVAASVLSEAKDARASIRTVTLTAGVPVFLALLGILYQLATSSPS